MIGGGSPADPRGCGGLGRGPPSAEDRTAALVSGWAHCSRIRSGPCCVIFLYLLERVEYVGSVSSGHLLLEGRGDLKRDAEWPGEEVRRGFFPQTRKGWEGEDTHRAPRLQTGTSQGAPGREEDPRSHSWVACLEALPKTFFSRKTQNKLSCCTPRDLSGPGSGPLSVPFGP